MILARHHEERFDVRCQLPVGERHLKLVFKVAVCAKTAQDDAGPDLVAEIDEHPVHALHADVGKRANDFARHFNTLLAREHGPYFGGGAGHGENDAVEYARRPLQKVQMAEGERIKRSGIHD